VYLILLAGSVFNVLTGLIANPLSIVSLLGAAIPSVAVFFINLILIKFLMGVSLMLSRIGPLLVTKLYSSCFNQKKFSIRAFLAGPLARVVYDYGVGIPGLLYIVVVFLLYWVIAPVVSGVSALFFMATYATFK
jgi:hypothetical protein